MREHTSKAASSQLVAGALPRLASQGSTRNTARAREHALAQDSERGHACDRISEQTSTAASSKFLASALPHETARARQRAQGISSNAASEAVRVRGYGRIETCLIRRSFSCARRVSAASMR